MQLICALLLQAALQSPAQPSIQPSAQPGIDEIRRYMFQRLTHDAERQIAGARWTKLRTDTDISTLNEEPKVEHREQYLVWGDGTRMLQQKVLRDGAVVTESAEPLAFFMEPAFLERYTFMLEEPAEAPCSDRTCWRLSFAPSPELVAEEGNIEQQLLARSIGTLLVDSSTYEIVRIDAHTFESYDSWKVDVHWFTVSIAQELHQNTMVTMTIEMTYSYKPLWGKAKTKRRYYRTVDVTLPNPPSE